MFRLAETVQVISSPEPILFWSESCRSTLQLPVIIYSGERDIGQLPQGVSASDDVDVNVSGKWSNDVLLFEILV